MVKVANFDSISSTILSKNTFVFVNSENEFYDIFSFLIEKNYDFEPLWAVHGFMILNKDYSKFILNYAKK